MWSIIAQTTDGTCPSTRHEDHSTRNIGARHIRIGGYNAFGHTGACAGFRSHVFRIPRLELNFVILTNSTNGWDLAFCVEAWIVGKLTEEDDLFRLAREE